MRVIRRAVAGVLLGCALLLAVAAGAPHLVDGQTVRDQLVVKLSAWAKGQLSVEGEVRLTSLFDLSIEAKDVRIESPARFPSVSHIEVEVLAARLDLWSLLNGRIVFKKVWVDRPVIQLREPFSQMAGNRLWRAILLDDGEAVTKLLAAAQDAPFSFIDFSHARLRQQNDKQRALPPFTVVFERDQEPQRVTLAGEIFSAPDPVSFRLERGAFRPAGPTLEAPVRFVTQSESAGRLTVNGRIVRANGARFMGDLEMEDASAHAVADWLGLPAGDAFANMRYSTSAALEATASKLSLQDLELEIGETRVTGLLNLELAGERPKLSGTLGLSRVDLRGLSVSGHNDGVLSATDPQSLRHGGLASHAHRIGEWLTRFDADLRLSAESLRLDGLNTGQTAAFLSVANGLATLDVAELVVFGGLINGQFSVRWVENAFRLSGKGKAAAIDLERLLSAGHMPRLATGPADISFAVEGAGPTLGAAMREMAVNGELIALQGGDLALDVAAMAVMARDEAMNADQPQTKRQMTSWAADFDMLRAAFVLRDRDLRIAPMAFAQDGWVIRGRGRADLAQQRFDWRLDAAQLPVETEPQNNAPMENHLFAADKQTISLHVTGSLQRPWVSYKMPELPLSSIESNTSWWP